MLSYCWSLLNTSWSLTWCKWSPQKLDNLTNTALCLAVRVYDENKSLRRFLTLSFSKKSRLRSIISMLACHINHMPYDELFFFRKGDFRVALVSPFYKRKPHKHEWKTNLRDRRRAPIKFAAILNWLSWTAGRWARSGAERKSGPLSSPLRSPRNF